MDSKFKARWIRALQKPVDQGGYIKGRGSLVQTVIKDGQEQDRFCCLGVAVDLLVQDGTIPEGWDKKHRTSWGSTSAPMEVQALLPHDIRDAIGLADSDQRRLATINDHGAKTYDDDRFANVIAYIEGID